MLQALKAWEQIAELQPGDGEVVKMLARLYHRLKDLDSAIRVLQVQPFSMLPQPLSICASEPIWASYGPSLLLAISVARVRSSFNIKCQCHQ